MRVLLVEDDPMIGSVVQSALRDASYAADWVCDGESALSTLQTLHYEMVLLDLNLPRTDGMSVLRAIRAARNDVPVLVLSAREATEDRVAGLDEGADDYLVKPFAMSELLARMRALVRRRDGGGNGGALRLGNGIVQLDPVTHEAKNGDAEAVRLTAREFSLLQALLVRPGAILSRAELEHRVYGWNEEVESNAIEFLIHALRKKLGSEVIKNVRGVGWMVAKAR
ncbi:response regulator transcription factor [Herbaspirillum sp. SJZ107]|uniref:response regulator transcription factor n=1 Tax=Herbaspirillum sp. SJZ107 TaxID=2572881 RepID=UPI001151AC71|nr:response regulator transcription factor [Herbaspirillum sp. SJZ107]TQK11287.1 two-component system OmpR family response regulator [Herbaspirillum sp. SJZ107]